MIACSRSNPGGPRQIKPLLPLIVEPDELEPHFGDENLLIVDLGPQELFDEAHVPGAVHLDRMHLASGVEPVLGGRVQRPRQKGQSAPATSPAP